MSFTNDIKNPSLFRQNMRTKFSEKFFNDENFATNLEIGTFNYAIQEANKSKLIKKWDNPAFVTLYINRLRTLFTNLSNPDLLDLIKQDEIAPKTLAFMTHQELCPDKWNELIEIKTKRDKNKFETNIVAATDTFTCRKCKSNQCTYYQMQTRSADEPMTTFVTCCECSTRWKC